MPLETLFIGNLGGGSPTPYFRQFCQKLREKDAHETLAIANFLAIMAVQSYLYFDWKLVTGD